MTSLYVMLSASTTPTQPQGSNTAAQVPGRLLLPLLSLHLAGSSTKKAEPKACTAANRNPRIQLRERAGGKELTPQHRDITQPGVGP